MISEKDRLILKEMHKCLEVDVGDRTLLGYSSERLDSLRHHLDLVDQGWDHLVMQQIVTLDSISTSKGNGEADQSRHTEIAKASLGAIRDLIDEKLHENIP